VKIVATGGGRSEDSFPKNGIFFVENLLFRPGQPPIPMKSFQRLDDHFALVPAALGRQLSAIDVARGRQEAFGLQNPGTLDALREVARVQSVEASNAIEGITAPRKRIEGLAAQKTTPRNRSEAEIAGYRTVLDTIHASGQHIPFRPNTVLQFHRDLYEFTGIPGGRWKSSDNLVTEELSDGTTILRFQPVAASATSAAMNELHARLREAWDSDLFHRLLLAGGYVLDFLVIHPFSDGNGRMSRLLSLLLLYQAGYEVGRFISLEKIIDEQKDTYYGALAASTQGWHDGAHTLEPWLSYFLGVIAAAYRQFEERVGTLTSGRGSKRNTIESFIRSHISDEFSIADVRRAAPHVSDVYIKQILRELKEAGVIERLGAGRAARWRRLRVEF
jgi:Fic family protein